MKRRNARSRGRPLEKSNARPRTPKGRRARTDADKEGGTTLFRPSDHLSVFYPPQLPICFMKPKVEVRPILQQTAESVVRMKISQDILTKVAKQQSLSQIGILLNPRKHSTTPGFFIFHGFSGGILQMKSKIKGHRIRSDPSRDFLEAGLLGHTLISTELPSTDISGGGRSILLLNKNGKKRRPQSRS